MMTASISSEIAKAHVADLHRVAEQRRSIRSAPRPNAAASTSSPAVELRLAGPDDGRAVEQLAALDDARVLEEPVMLALIDAEAVAALSLRDGRVVANPFVPTEAAVALLRLRARHVSGKRSGPRWPVVRRPRFA